MDMARRIVPSCPIAIALAALAVIASCLGGCTEPPAAKTFIQSLYLGPEKAKQIRADDYKTQVAQHIETVNADEITPGRPQAMLRSVVVVTFVVDRNGKILRSSVFRTNGDDAAEHEAITTLRRSAPLPPPPSTVLNAAGQVELMEGWLFNTDGHFQLQSLAAPQQDGGDSN
ncbi:TonB family protein [Pararobbsia silviterrae]|nr:TonB family protein [Pararobbsia silviterrae]